MIVTGRTIRRGQARGRVLLSTLPLSFFGGIDPHSGVVIDRGHPLEGRSIAGRVLVFPHGKGSTVGSYTLYRLARNGHAPAAMVVGQCETIVAVGAIIAEIPCIDLVDITRLRPDRLVMVDAGAGTVEAVEP